MLVGVKKTRQSKKLVAGSVESEPNKRSTWCGSA
jgi:hypothetical protein